MLDTGDHILMPHTAQLVMSAETTTVWLWESCVKAPLRMAGHRMPMVTTVQAAILIGQTGQSITSPPI